MEQLAEEEQKLIIVTGFGPFVGHEDVNASWEAVKQLPDDLDFKGVKYVLEKQMIPVEYEAVDQAVQKIWRRKPELVIHCGVNGMATCINVEKLAYNHKFKRPDYAGKRLSNGSACLANCGNNNNVLHCGLNVKQIVEALKDSCPCISSTTGATETAGPVLKVSKNVGDYLCGYIYIKSLDMNKNRSLFVHVPPIDRPLSSRQTSAMIYKIVEECMRQLVEESKDIC